jgi:hypothetical protein
MGRWDSRDTLVGIATGNDLGGRGLITGRGKRCFSSSQRSDRLWGTRNFLSNGYRGLFLGVKRPGREADHSSPSNAEVKNGGAQQIIKSRGAQGPVSMTHPLYTYMVELYLHSPTCLQ